MKRTIVIGDIHGCLVELRNLLDPARFQAGEDRLIFLGDFLDRGPDTMGVLRFVCELADNHGAVALRGNHEEKYLRWHRWQTSPPGRGSTPMSFSEKRSQVYARLSPVEISWLAERPCYFQGDGFLAVHGGVSPSKHRTVEDFSRNRRCRDLLLRIRRVDAQGAALRLSESYPSEARPWWQDYDGRFGIVFYGHQHMPDVVLGPFSVGLDTGCCFGGCLTAAIFTQAAEYTLLSVKAHAAHHPVHEEED